MSTDLPGEKSKQQQNGRTACGKARRCAVHRTLDMILRVVSLKDSRPKFDLFEDLAKENNPTCSSGNNESITAQLNASQRSPPAVWIK